MFVGVQMSESYLLSIRHRTDNVSEYLVELVEADLSSSLRVERKVQEISERKRVLQDEIRVLEDEERSVMARAIDKNAHESEVIQRRVALVELYSEYVLDRRSPAAPTRGQQLTWLEGRREDLRRCGFEDPEKALEYCQEHLVR